MLLKVENLSVHYMQKFSPPVLAVDRVDFQVGEGEMVGLVGESGSGKSTLGLAIMKLVPPPGKIVSGRILLNGRDLVPLSEKEMRFIRGREISMVFQDPMTSLDPLMRIGDHLIETILAHEKISKKEAEERAIKLLQAVGISPDRFHDYPHQMSGGMRQRVMIALALALNPKLVIADEPTTALDVIVQDQIIDLFKNLRNQFKVAIVMVSHDLALELEATEKMAVMYGGWIMEFSRSVDIARDPLHPYTEALLKAIPNVELDSQKLISIPGNPPDLSNPPKGCRFHPRCPYAEDVCREKEPPTHFIDGRYVKCWLFGSDRK